MTSNAPPQRVVPDIWYTRCPVPTASGIALRNGWLHDEFDRAGAQFGVLQDAPPHIALRHYDHQLPGLLREGGNVPALAARAEGTPTRLIGLTWIEERQVVVARPGEFAGPDGLDGRRLAVPRWAATRAMSFPRAMALRGLSAALGMAGRTLLDADLVEVASSSDRAPGPDPAAATLWPGLAELAAGEVDAVYLKGGRAAEQAADLGFVVIADLDRDTDPRDRVNNGTPRPLTVHQDLLAAQPDLVDRFLVQTLRAARWAARHPDKLRELLGSEVGSGATGVASAYGSLALDGLTPDLSEHRLALLDRQQRFLYSYGFLESPVDVTEWVDHGPLERALVVLKEEQAA